MRANLKKNSCIAFQSSFRQTYPRLCSLEEYTFLNAPIADISNRITKLELCLSNEFYPQLYSLQTDYINLLKCFDGGMLFGTLVFSIDSYHGDSNDYDIYTINKMLYEERSLPPRYLAIAMLSYGDYIVISSDNSRDGIIVWSIEDQTEIGHWKNIGEWIDEECDIANKLISENVLEKCEE